jgi:hypothetical protein
MAQGQGAGRAAAPPAHSITAAPACCQPLTAQPLSGGRPAGTAIATIPLSSLLRGSRLTSKPLAAPLIGARRVRGSPRSSPRAAPSLPPSSASLSCAARSSRTTSASLPGARGRGGCAVAARPVLRPHGGTRCSRHRQPVGRLQHVPPRARIMTAFFLQLNNTWRTGGKLHYALGLQHCRRPCCAYDSQCHVWACLDIVLQVMPHTRLPLLGASTPTARRSTVPVATPTMTSARATSR